MTRYLIATIFLINFKKDKCCKQFHLFEMSAIVKPTETEKSMVAVMPGANGEGYRVSVLYNDYVLEV